MDSEITFLVEESLDGGYEARALGHSIFTQGETLEEVRKAVREAVECHFDPADRPHVLRIHHVKEEVLAL